MEVCFCYVVSAVYGLIYCFKCGGLTLCSVLSKSSFPFYFILFVLLGKYRSYCFSYMLRRTLRAPVFRPKVFLFKSVSRCRKCLCRMHLQIGCILHSPWLIALWLWESRMPLLRRLVPVCERPAYGVAAFLSFDVSVCLLVGVVFPVLQYGGFFPPGIEWK